MTTELAARNKQIVREIFDKIVNGGDAELAADFYKEDYIQHNPNVAQGLAGLQDLIRQMHAGGKPMRAEIKLMNAEDDMVWLLVERSGGEIPEGAPPARSAEAPPPPAFNGSGSSTPPGRGDMDLPRHPEDRPETPPRRRRGPEHE